MRLLNRKTGIFVLAASVAWSISPAVAFAAEMKVTVATSVLADMAFEIGGGSAEIYTVASPRKNLHTVQPTPRDVLKTRKADIFISHGLGAEPWLMPLLNAAGNKDFMTKNGHHIDASHGIVPLEVPDVLSRLDGDIHPQGNPHCWLDPENAKRMAENIAEGFSRFMPEKKDFFRANRDAFIRRVDEKMIEWSARLKPFEGISIVTYHRSWSYFTARFKLNVAGEIEPKPGIPPGSQYLADLAARMETAGVRLVVKEPFFESKTPKKVASMTGAKLIELIQFPGAVSGAEDYLSMMEYNVRQIEEALREN